MRRGAPLVQFRPRLFVALIQLVSLPEFFNLSFFTTESLLLSRIVRMAGGANFNLETLSRRKALETGSACTGNYGLVPGGMDLILHLNSPLDSFCICHFIQVSFSCETQGIIAYSPVFGKMMTKFIEWYFCAFSCIFHKQHQNLCPGL
jgi:hypothetical protein